MSPQKKMKISLNDDNTEECLQLIEENDCGGLMMKINSEMVNHWIYPDGTESSKTRLIFHTIKQERLDCIRLLLKCGVDVNLGHCDDDSCNNEYISASPLQYCIERNSSLETMCVLLNQKDCLITESHIKSAILSDNASALQLLLESDQVSKSETSIINVRNIIKLYADHCDVPIVNTLKILSKFVDFLSVGGDPEGNHRTIDGRPTLTYFAQTRTNCSFDEAVAIVKFCVRLKCSINTKLVKDIPLHAAMDSNNRNFVKALVKCKANVNRVNSRGVTLLYEALQRSDDDLFEFLLLNGADSTQQNAKHYRESVIPFVIKNGLFNRMCQIIELDKKLFFPNEKQNKVPVLHAILEYFIRYGLPVNSQTENPMKIVEACLARGVDINGTCSVEQVVGKLSFKGHTVLHLAVRFFCSDFCEQLIILGADLHLLTDFNQCSYALAMDYAYVFNRDVDRYVNQEDESVKKFLMLEKYGVDLKKDLPVPLNYSLNYKNYSDSANRFTCHSLNRNRSATLLHVLLWSNLSRLAETLFYLITTPETLYVRDVCLALKTENFFLSYQVLKNVQKEFNYESIKLTDLAPLFKGSILTRNNKRFVDPVLTFSPDSPEAMILKTLSMKGFDINSVDEFENSIFHYACQSKRFLDEAAAENFVRLILELGGKKSLDCLNKRLQSPLHFALSTKENFFVPVLLRHDADFRRKTKLGYSAIHIAINSGAVSSIEYLVQRSLPKNDLINSWRRINVVKAASDDNYINEVNWREERPCEFYIVTPLTVAIVRKDKEMIKLLISKYGAMLGKKDIHNSIVVNSATPDFSIANFLFEFFPKSGSLKHDCLYNNKEPTLEYVFHKLLTVFSLQTINYVELESFIMNFVSRGYDINERHGNCPPVLYSLTKLAIKTNAVCASGIIRIFNYLMDYTDWGFTTFSDIYSNSLLTLLMCSIECRNTCSFDMDSGKITKLTRQAHFLRNYLVRLFLQRCPYSLWAWCRFEKYVYHKEDYEILEAILLTEAKGNLICEWPNVQMCLSGKSVVNLADNFISIEKFSSKINLSHRDPPTLAELSIMAIKNFSGLRVGYMNLDLPKKTKELIQFIDVENDGELSWEIFTLDQ